MKFRKFIKESLKDMDKRCPECNNLLNDMGTCPYCDHGEEELNEALYHGKQFNTYLSTLFSQRNAIKRAKDLYNENGDKVDFEEGGWKISCGEDGVAIREGSKPALVLSTDMFRWERPFGHLAPSLQATVMKPVHGVFLGQDSIKQSYTDNEIRFKNPKPEQMELIYFYATAIQEGKLDELLDKADKFIHESLTESASCEYRVEQFADDWYGIADSKGKFYKENGKQKFFKSSDEAEEYIKTMCSSSVNEAMSNKEKLKAAYPELNFDASVTESVVVEEISNREKLLRAYPELNFDNAVVEESLTEKMSVRDRLKAAYPELNFDTTVTESARLDPEDEIEEFDDYSFDYDDDYDFDDVEADYAHASLYGGDLTYCKHCGTRLERNEWGGYCPECDKDDIDQTLKID